MKYILTFLASILTFLGLDAVWINFVAQPELTKIASGYLAAQPNLAAAIIFYLIYIIGVLFISLKFGNNPKSAAVNGLMLGVLAYSRYYLGRHLNCHNLFCRVQSIFKVK